MAFEKKTFDNSFFFTQYGEMDKHHKNIAEFIIGAQRIEDKNGDAFRGILEDVKRSQKTSVLYSVLLRDDVVICVNKIEMPRAFKVFAAKDLKTDRQTKVFIDATGLISMVNGYYVCKKPDVFATYLFQALGWLLYNNDTLKLMNDSTVTINGTYSFAALCDYLIGYFRFFGYQENRQKVIYLCSLYYLVHIMGKDNDLYTQGLAAKVANITPSLASAYKLYYTDDCFKDIHSFITNLASVFKFKGLTTEVFISKWIYLYGEGTQYACELFTGFTNLMIATYCGVYIVNQKKVESLCAKYMVNFVNAIMKLGVDLYDKRYMMGEAALNDLEVIKSKETIALAEARLREKTTTYSKFDKNSCSSVNKAKSDIASLTSYYRSIDKPQKISPTILSDIRLCIHNMDRKKLTDNYEVGVLTEVIKGGKKYLNSTDKSKILDEIKHAISTQNEFIIKIRLTDKELHSKLVKQVTELKKVRNLI